ncbi:MAG: sulfate reduction electron transfer complex DsrMKJOP subunit DsrJ [Spirochaetia bacterium]|nr:sulfate reduction electron transfer complex DsrMKJOP subunit DsrJ [Spirochaetia bacterium]
MFKMYSKIKVFTGVFIFLALATFPFWNKVFIVSKTNYEMPDANIKPALAFARENGFSGCIEDRAFMRAKHMKLLNHWRNEVVRENKKTYINSKGEHFNKSLTGTCLKCHSNKEEFCDSCHTSAGVKPYCFDCHITGIQNTNQLNSKAEAIHEIK